MILQTERLLLRRWQQSDKPAFAELNADPAVMEFLPKLLSAGESDKFVDKIEQHFVDHGFGLWAVELAQPAEFVGFVGLWPTNFEAHFTPAVEVAWRLKHSVWGCGYAPEAARAALADGFGRLGLQDVISFTSQINLRSIRVMQKLGMSHSDVENFDHPLLESGDSLQTHVLYRLTAEAFARTSG